jgi:hypothetical protein
MVLFHEHSYLNSVRGIGESVLEGVGSQTPVRPKGQRVRWCWSRAPACRPGVAGLGVPLCKSGGMPDKIVFEDHGIIVGGMLCAIDKGNGLRLSRFP